MNTSSPLSKSLSSSILAALEQGKKIQAIKLLRDEQNLELKEAKQMIDQYIQENPAIQRHFSLSSSENIRNTVLIFLLILAFVTIMYFL